MTKLSDGSVIPIVFASAERAFATISELYGEPNCTRVPLPAMALSRSDISDNRELYVHKQRSIYRYDDAPNHTKVKVAQSPQPKLLTYTLEAWCRTMREMNNLILQLSTKFNLDLAYIRVDLEEFGVKRFALKLESSTDASELEYGEQDRKLRHSLTMTLNGVFHKPMRTIETVKSVDVTWQDEVGNDLETKELVSE